jgi:hypothetical protein
MDCFAYSRNDVGAPGLPLQGLKKRHAGSLKLEKQRADLVRRRNREASSERTPDCESGRGSDFLI